MKQGQRLTENGHDVALFPMEVMRITTLPMEVGTTHELTLNIDLAGVNSGKSDMYAPFTMKVAKNANTSNHEIIWWSTDLVKCADRKERLLTIRTLHDDDVSDLKVGVVKIQGEVATQEGNTGQSHGNHIHMGIAEGHTTKLVKRANGYHDLENAIDPRNVFFINDTIIKQTMGTKWETYVPPVLYAPMTDFVGQYVCNDNVWIREFPTINSAKILLLPANTLVDVSQVSANKQDGYNWAKIKHGDIVGYCAQVEGSNVTEKVIVTEPIVTPIEVVEPIIEPEIVIPVIVEPEPIITEEPVIIPEPITETTPIVLPEPITNTNETQTTHHEPVNVLYKIIIAIIELILKLIKGK